MNETLTIPRSLANRLLTLAQLTPDAEICGFISRREDQQYHVYPVDNIAADSSRLFEMEPQQQLAGFKNMREQKESLFAIFHSHPHSAAIPSEKDLNDSSYTEALNIIISLSIQGVLDMRGYFYRNNSVEAVDLVID
ncbi:hypothetical protein MNBD_GAMMA09-2987 [hydrothermal vent metagenome]|uniref:JAB domain-containing protein n=1 Tax=hydrothermal vent metagenome TaxID=652676 RepID=A0A3B0XQE9_9ZZZZ